MSVDIYCNGFLHSFKSVPFYKDVVNISTNIDCTQEKNKILIYCNDPRINIDSLLYCSDFIFNNEIIEDSYGQIISKMLLNYNYTSMKYKFDFVDINILTKGKLITNIIIFMPKNNKIFLRELLYLSYKRKEETCYICYEEKNNIIELHHNHKFCLDCILKLKQKKCPICRDTIL